MGPSASTEAGCRRGGTERLGSSGPELDRAAALLAAGRLVAFPTETVYGLGADGRSPEAVAALYAAKGRPSFNPLIAHVCDVAAARREGVLDRDSERLAAAFWPGPLTLVVPRLPGDTRSPGGTRPPGGTVCDLACAGLDSIGLRVPAHPVAQALLARCGFPVVAPSANLSGRISPTGIDDVLADLDGRIAAAVDGGATDIGVESTIVACLGGPPRLLRPGGVAREALERVLGHPLGAASADAERPLAPGGLSSHYAPRARVRLNAGEIRPGEAALLFGPGRPAGLDGAAARLDLSPAGDPVEAAANLYGFLRRLDASGAGTIAVVAIPETGLGEAINDRLRRAAAER